jgi:hypothetical protein
LLCAAASHDRVVPEEKYSLSTPRRCTYFLRGNCYRTSRHDAVILSTAKDALRVWFFPLANQTI